MEPTHASGFLWWWRSSGSRARLVVVRPFALVALLGLLALLPSFGWWPLVLAGLALPCWARMSIDEQGANVVDYWLFIPWSRRVLDHPIELNRDEGFGELFRAEALDMPIVFIEMRTPIRSSNGDPVLRDILTRQFQQTSEAFP